MPIRALAPIINQYDPASRRACGSAWDIAQGIGWAAARTPRPRVINMSFGFSDRSSYEKQAIEDAAGMLYVLFLIFSNQTVHLQWQQFVLVRLHLWTLV
jgi:hypothetical protein